MFLDPSKPIITCTQTSCENCPLSVSIHCHFQGVDLAKFFAAVLPAFILGGVGVYRLGIWFFVPWVLFTFSYFGFIEIRVMCSHCPHYAEAGSSLKCWANYGSPTLWRYRPGPLSGMENAVFFAGLVIILGYPLVLLLVHAQWLLAILFSVAVAGGYLYMRKAMCSRCMNFACPLNLVDEGRQEMFFQMNPEVGAAWEKK